MTDQYLLTPYFLDEPVPLLQSLVSAGWQTNAPLLPEGKKQARMGALYQPLATFIAQAVVRGARPVSIAGDCCTSIGVLAGLQRAGMDPFLIWLDAHGDFNTWETTPSGFLGGMPLAMLVGRGEMTIPHAVGLQALPEEQVLLTDARDLDPGEREAVESSRMLHLADPLDLPQHVPSGRPLYVHFDTDILRPKDAPAMNYLAPGGPPATELRRVFSALAKTGRVAAVSVSTWNPVMDTDSRTKEVCMDLLSALLGTD